MARAGAPSAEHGHWQQEGEFKGEMRVALLLMEILFT